MGELRSECTDCHGRDDPSREYWRDGQIKPHVSEIFPLAEGGRAIEKLASREAMGKLVVTMKKAHKQEPWEQLRSKVQLPFRRGGGGNPR